MNKITERKILLEYYETVSAVLQFERSDESVELTDKVLELLLDIFGAVDGRSDIFRSVEAAECLRTASDAMLMTADGVKDDEPAMFIKAEAIIRLGIEKPRHFDLPMLSLRAERTALNGERSSCKLLACMKWLGIGMREDRGAALGIWKMLAANGDPSAIQAAAYACGEMGDLREREKWKLVGAALAKAENEFLPMVFDIPLDDGAELANLILVAKSNSRQNGKSAIDRAMAYYMLYCGDSFEEKLEVLSSEKNFYPAIWESHKFNGKKYGF